MHDSKQSPVSLLVVALVFAVPVILGAYLVNHFLGFTPNLD